MTTAEDLLAIPAICRRVRNMLVIQRRWDEANEPTSQHLVEALSDKHAFSSVRYETTADELKALDEFQAQADR